MPSVIGAASWRVQSKNYSGAGNWLDEIGAVPAVPGPGANAPAWDAANVEFDYTGAQPDYHDMGNAAILDPGAGSFSVMVWMRVAALGTANTVAMTKRTSTGAAVPGWRLACNAANQVNVSISDGVTQVTASTTATFGLGYFTAGAVYDAGADTLTPYLNGVAGTPVAANLGSLANAVNAYLAVQGNLGVGTSLNGSLKAAVFFKGTALTAAQMAQLNTEVVNTYSAVIDDGLGLTDPATVALAARPSDNEGLTDTPRVGLGATLVDPEGLTDIPAVGVTATLADQETLADLAASAVGATLADPEGLTDTPSAHPGVVVSDPEGLTDDTASRVGVVVVDDENLTDEVTAVVPLTAVCLALSLAVASCHITPVFGMVILNTLPARVEITISCRPCA